MSCRRRGCPWYAGSSDQPGSREDSLMLSLGLDVHVRNSYLCAQDSDGRTLVRGRYANTADDFSRALAPLARRAQESGQPVRAVLESTTNSRAVARLLERYGQDQGLDLTAEVLDAR